MSNSSTSSAPSSSGRTATATALKQPARLVRLQDWWNSKLPPLFAVAYLLLAGPPAAAPRAVGGAMLLFLASAFFTAAWGHLLNDVADADADRRAGKPSPISTLPRAAASALVVLTLLLAIGPWLVLPPSGLARAAFALELVLLAAYALPPLRLKERGLAGLVADALYGHALPMAIAVGLFDAMAPGAPLTAATVALLIGWKLAQGLCGALASQIADRRSDHRSRTRTWVTGGAGAGRPRALAAQRILLRLLLPLQLVAFVAALAALFPRWPWLLPAYLLFLLARVAQVHLVWKRGATFYRRGYPGYALLNDFHERWLPLVALALLVAADPRYLALAALHLLLFRNGLGDVLRPFMGGRRS